MGAEGRPEAAAPRRGGGGVNVRTWCNWIADWWPIYLAAAMTATLIVLRARGF